MDLFPEGSKLVQWVEGSEQAVAMAKGDDTNTQICKTTCEVFAGLAESEMKDFDSNLSRVDGISFWRLAERTIFITCKTGRKFLSLTVFNSK